MLIFIKDWKKISLTSTLLNNLVIKIFFIKKLSKTKMNQPKSLHHILKIAFDHYPNSRLVFDGFESNNGTISYIELKSHTENVKLVFLIWNIFK